MIRIRLRRVGKKRTPYYRLVVADQRSKRDGDFLETLGSYDPHANPPSVQLDEAKAREWLGKGAQPSEAAEKILRRAGVLAAAAPVARGGAKAAAVTAPAAAGGATPPGTAAEAEVGAAADAAATSAEIEAEE